MLKLIDKYLNQVTMYRLILYGLFLLVAIAFSSSFFKLLPFSPVDLLYSTLIALVASLVVNRIFAWAFDAQTNIESAYISALIIVLIITPSTANLSFIFWASALAMASKYLVAVFRKHLFNPVALAVVLTAYTLNQSPSWWVGTVSLMPFVALIGILVVRKIRRADLILSFLLTVLVAVAASDLLKNISPLTNIYRTIFQSAILFFALFMLSEPLTTPPTRRLRIAYGVLVGLFFIPALHFGPVYPTPELALILGNIFSYLASPKEKLLLKLKEKKHLAKATYEFSFALDRPFNFTPGQYMEWTLSHRDPDSRGNRRYFTLASSPTENELKLGVKFYPEPSSFKNRLLYLEPGEEIVASQCAGDFAMPKDVSKKLAFIAGGIGVTPFRSMIKYCLDNNEVRDIVMFYSNRSVEDVAYREIFAQAAAKMNIKTVYVLTDSNQVSDSPETRLGRLSADIIKTEALDYLDRIFYVSGPPALVSSFEKLLLNLGVPRKQIKIDFFPGFVEAA
jgi:ferredoxin-NADP reductase